MRWYVLLAPMGALMACASGTGSDITEEDEDVPRYEDKDDLTGGYESCEAALVALGEEPMDPTRENTSIFDVEFLEARYELRPWIVVVSPLEGGDYRISCAENYGSSANARVVPELDEYWSCSFEAKELTVFNPESDPRCNEGWDSEIWVDDDPYVLASVGRCVRDVHYYD